MADSETCITILCFSKDRPLQLEGYLTSVFETCREPLSMTVLYTYDSQFKAAYEKIENEFSNVNFITQTDFTKQVSNIIKRANTPLFMFGCDDVIFKGSWQPSKIIEQFQKTPRLLAFSLRLGKEITYCHPLNRDMPLPRFREEDPLLIWTWHAGEVDWGYPWELDCTAYSTRFVRSFMRNFKRPIWARHKFDWSNPNKLEALGAGFITRETTLDLMGSYPTARACVLAVNRVQDTFANPVYKSDFTTNELLQMWRDGKRLDTSYYFGRTFKSIHIGDAQFCRSSNHVLSTEKAAPGGR